MSDSLRPHGLEPTRLLCWWGLSWQVYWSGLPCPPPGGSSQLRDQTQVSCAAGGFFTSWTGGGGQGRRLIGYTPVYNKKKKDGGLKTRWGKGAQGLTSSILRLWETWGLCACGHQVIKHLPPGGSFSLCKTTQEWASDTVIQALQRGATADRGEGSVPGRACGVRSVIEGLLTSMPLPSLLRAPLPTPEYGESPPKWASAGGELVVKPASGGRLEGGAETARLRWDLNPLSF